MTNQKTKEEFDLSKVLDVTAAGRRMWFDKQDNRAEFYNGDFTQLPYSDSSFSLVVFDPPHCLGPHAGNGIIFKKYGALNKQTWKEDLKKGFSECWRVLRPHGTLVFKWSENQIKIAQLQEFYPDRPLFGHPTLKKTIWVTFHKLAGDFG